VSLSLIIFAPLVFAVAGAFLPEGRAPVLLALLGTLVSAILGVYLLIDFDTTQAGLQFTTDRQWIEALGIRYSLGVDGLSVWLVGLTTILFAASAAWVVIRPVARSRQWAVLMAVAEAAVIGAFVAQDLALFVLCYDLMLVPFLFLMFGWGGPDRRAATIKMMVFTLVGSLLMLAAAVALAVLSAQEAGGSLTFSMAEIGQTTLGAGTQKLLFVAFALAFLIKMPAFLVQGWMPDTYRTMPLPALGVFAAILSKVAAYGFIKITLPLLPEGVDAFQLVLQLLAVAGIIYGSCMAFTQTNLRLILGYSSLAQLSFIVLGIFSLEQQGLQGAILQSITHALVVWPLMFVVMLVGERAGGSEDVRDLGGLATRGPVMATLSLILAFATLAIPGSANFVGEFYILLGTFRSSVAIACVASIGVALASVYMLRAYIRMVHNRVGEKVTGREISVRDGLVLVPVVLAVLAFGLYPQGALNAGEQALAPSGAQPEVAAEVAP
jgi:NADH-quinone oxidoreductase subunit M